MTKWAIRLKSDPITDFYLKHKIISAIFILLILGSAFIKNPLALLNPVSYIAVLGSNHENLKTVDRCDYSQFTADNIDTVFTVCNESNIDFNKLYKICDREWDIHKNEGTMGGYSQYMSCVDQLVYTNHVN